MTAALDPAIHVLPRDWTGGAKTTVRPGDLGQFAPQGLGLGAPMIVTPYSGAPDPGFYGAQGTITHPIRSAPVNDDAGGVIYFSSHTRNEDLGTALDLMGAQTLARHYAVFLGSSSNPREDGYLDQMRIIGHSALAHMFGCKSDDLPEQVLDAGTAIQRFLDWQRQKWDDGRGEFGLAGLLGGDGDWARERLAFGAMVENSYWGVARIWSRAWLITK